MPRPPHRVPLVPSINNVSPRSNVSGNNAPSGSNIPGGSQAALENDTGTVLQTSATIAGLAAAVLALLPASPALANLKLIEIGGRLAIPCSFALLLCGTTAIFSSIGAINSLRKEKNISLRFRFFGSSLGFLLISLILFFTIYIGITINYIHP